MKIIEGSQSGHDCCFSHTILDETKPLPPLPKEAFVDGVIDRERFDSLCECHDFYDAFRIIKALNRPTEIYIVRGNTGEYCDWREWDVKAYFSKKLAESHRLQAQTFADNLDRTKYEAVSPYDPWIKMDYNGVHYTVVELDFYGGD